ncbi:hypothetical protein [Parasporobacterium paucivorans]|uniref:Uncharacterized protein n=1 Tax=Parasporobacterium paucivorans DSM 15970 TaxID=1122934 RepID=A0A1M6GT14_9FIRM|nr:hypothetical protein [Parasporobacterium paucivorans]SHJ13071.1 hypothetical protein SAMN02745691_01381 [Parasporobacterium paucivorans DSM 15970]
MSNQPFKELTRMEKAEVLKKKIEEVSPAIVSEYYNLYGNRLIQLDINVTEFMNALEFMDVYCQRVIKSSLPCEVPESEINSTLNLFNAILLEDSKNITPEDVRNMKPVCKEMYKSTSIMNSAMAKRFKDCYRGFFKKLDAGL